MAVPDSWLADKPGFQQTHADGRTTGLPVRIHPTPGQRGDSPQAVGLLSSLRGVGHVIADAAYADPLRAFIADELGATAQIKASSRRATAHQLAALQGAASGRILLQQGSPEFVEGLKRFRRIALRREKTLPAFMGLVHLACAMIWLR